MQPENRSGSEQSDSVVQRCQSLTDDVCRHAQGNFRLLAAK
jgi:hypothetical protein